MTPATPSPPAPGPVGGPPRSGSRPPSSPPRWPSWPPSPWSSRPRRPARPAAAPSPRGCARAPGPRPGRHGHPPVALRGEGSSVPAEDKPLLETTAAYGAVGQYGALPPGSYAVSVRPAGTPVSEPPVLSLTVELEAGQAYTVAGLGTKAEPRLERLVDDLTPPADGSANVRLLPASLAAPTVDVQAEGGPVLARGAALGQPTGYTAAPAGTWTVRASGGSASGTTALELAPGSVYTLLVLDSEDGSLVVEPVVDAVGIGTPPVGGAATGLGGLADDGAALPAPAAWSLAVLLARG